MTNIIQTLASGLVAALRPKEQQKPAPNVYSWQFSRRKGHSIASINRNGTLWCRLTVFGGKSDQRVRDYINEHDNNWIER